MGESEGRPVGIFEGDPEGRPVVFFDEISVGAVEGAATMMQSTTSFPA